MEIYTKVISFVNQKGGVGKTSICYHLAGTLATEFDKKILVLDLDSQGNLSECFENNIGEYSSYDLFTKKVGPETATVETNIKNIDLITANIKLANLDLDIADKKGRLKLLKNKIDKEKLNYDYVFIDCPPALSLLTNNSLVASDSILIPAQVGLFSLKGLSKLIKTYKIIKKKHNQDLEIEGVVLNRIDRRTKYDSFKDQLKDRLGDKLFDTVIGQSIKVSRSQFERVPISLYDSSCKTAAEFENLAQEVINNEL